VLTMRHLKSHNCNFNFQRCNKLHRERTAPVPGRSNVNNQAATSPAKSSRELCFSPLITISQPPS
jgi:hypothetical protein